MKNMFLSAALFALSFSVQAETKVISSPTGNLKLYVDTKDAQPRCPGCINVTLEVNTRLPMGAPIISDIQSRIAATHLPKTIAAFVTFKEVSRNQTKAIYKGSVAIPSILIRETQGLSLQIEGYGRACLNGANLDCSFLEVKDDLVAPMEDVLKLGN